MHVCGCQFELIVLAVLSGKQVAILLSFWLYWCECASRLDRDDSVSSPPRARPWLDALRVPLLVSHWPFGPTLIGFCVLVCEKRKHREKKESILWCLARELGGRDYCQEARDSGCKLWQVSHYTRWHRSGKWWLDTAAAHIIMRTQAESCIKASRSTS